MSFLLERDALNGKSGSGFITINGENHQMFGMKKFQSDAEFQEEDFKVVGTNLVQTKTTGVKLSGTMTLYYGSPYFLQLLNDYLKTCRISLCKLKMMIHPPQSEPRPWCITM